MLGKFRITVRFQYLVAVPFALLILCASGLIGYLSFQNGQLAVTGLAGDLSQEITDHIEQQLDSYLAVPILVNKLNLDAIQLGEFDLHNQEAIGQKLLYQLKHFDTLTSIVYANEQREYVEPLRYILGTNLSIGRSSQATDYALTIYDLTPGGNQKVIATYPDYDPRTRPWYQAAVKAGRQVWSPIYVWKSGYLGLDAATPVYSADHQLLGVLSSSFTLDTIHAYLQKMKISQHGQAFILDRSGFLIASSVGNVTRQRAGEEAVRISAEQASDPVLRAAFRALQQEAGGLENITTAYSYRFSLGSETYLARTTAFHDEYGLDWLIITAIPLSDFMTPLTAGNRQTAGLIGLAVLISTFLSILISLRVTRPVLQLNETARAIARGEWHRRVKVNRPDEIGELSSSFNEMAGQVQTAFEAVQASERRYQSLFEESPISLWHEDGSVLKQHLDEIRARGVTDWQGYFDEHPEEVRACAAMLKVVHVNRATLAMFETSTQAALPTDILPFFNQITFSTFRNELIALAGGSLYYETDTGQKTLLGNEILVHLRMNIIPGYEDSWARILVLKEDITRRKRSDDILQARLRLMQFASTHSMEEVLQATLEEAEKMTGSSVGFYHFLGSDQKDLVLQTCPANTPNTLCTLIERGKHYHSADAGIWGECIRERKPVIHNHEAALRNRNALPEGCLSVTRALAVPVFRGERIVAVVGVGNKAQDYGPSDAENCLQLVDFSWEIAERKQAEEALRNSEERFSRAFQASPFMVTISRLADAVFLEVNEAFEKLTGFSSEETVGHSAFEMGIWANPADRKFLARKLTAAGRLRNHEVELRAKDGRRLAISLSAELLELEGETCVLSTLEDITERKKAEAHILRLNRLYATISHINETIVRASDKESLFRDICRVAIEYGQFRMAWIGFLDERMDRVVPFAFAGEEAGYLNNIEIRLWDERLAQGPTGTAIREGHCIICQDIATDPRMATWRAQALERGYCSVAAVPVRAKGSIIGVLNVYSGEPSGFNAEDEELLEQIGADVSFALDSIEAEAKRKQAEADLVESYDTTLEGWARALELKDNETIGHSRRVIEKTVAIARAMGFDEADLVHIRRGAILHDIGKMGIPDEILRKDGPLSGEERQIVMRHPQTAYDFLKPIPYLQAAIDIPYCHHEKWDGTGYPRGLKGTEIPLSARIFAVVDVWDALSSDRPYRHALSPQAVTQYLISEAGKHFDPQVVEVFLRV